MRKSIMILSLLAAGLSLSFALLPLADAGPSKGPAKGSSGGASFGGVLDAGTFSCAGATEMDCSVDGILTLKNNAGAAANLHLGADLGLIRPTAGVLAITDGSTGEGAIQFGAALSLGTRIAGNISQEGRIDLQNRNGDLRMSISNSLIDSKGTGFAIRRGGGGRIDLSSSNSIRLHNSNGALANKLQFGFATLLDGSGDGLLLLTDAAGTGFDRVQLACVTSGCPAIQRNGAGLDFILGDDSGLTNIETSAVGNAGAVLSLTDGLAIPIGTIAADDTTPDVTGASHFTTSANTGATVITDLDLPTVGQVIEICGGSSTNSSTIADAGNFSLVSPITLSLDTCITLRVRADNDYVEVSRNITVPSIATAESDGDLSTTGTGFTQKVRLTFIAEATTYMLHYSAEIRTSDSGTRVIVQVEEDDTTLHATVDPIPESGDLVGYGSFSGFRVVTLTAGSHDFDMDFASETGGNTVNIRRARLVAMKVQ